MYYEWSGAIMGTILNGWEDGKMGRWYAAFALSLADIKT
jgi:hypothetical protein